MVLWFRVTFERKRHVSVYKTRAIKRVIKYSSLFIRNLQHKNSDTSLQFDNWSFSVNLSLSVVIKAFYQVKLKDKHVVVKFKEITGAPEWVAELVRMVRWDLLSFGRPAAHLSPLERDKYVTSKHCHISTPYLTRFHLQLSCCSSPWRGSWTGVLTWVRSLGLLPVSATREGHTPLSVQTESAQHWREPRGAPARAVQSERSMMGNGVHQPTVERKK